MNLQQQLTFQKLEYDSVEEHTFSNRLSRVVTKLFSRVLKSEEAAIDAFAPDKLDIESLICATEDMLVRCMDADQKASDDDVDTSKTCREMAKSLVTAMINSQAGSTSLRSLMIDLGIEPGDSALGSILNDIEAEQIRTNDAFASINEPVQHTQVQDVATDSIGNNNDITTLVSGLGGAPMGPERDAALEALREYIKMHGDGDLKAHLEQVSPAFRDYIEEQLNRRTQTALDSRESGSVSERLRNLRSRLQATELAVQTNTNNDDPEASEGSPSESSTSLNLRPTPRSSGLVKPSPSKLPPPSSSAPAKSLRERLAATRKQQTANAAPPTDTNGSVSRAAALRARLEAVKNKQQASS